MFNWSSEMDEMEEKFTRFQRVHVKKYVDR